MSIPFSDTITKNGLVQIFERRCGFNDGDVSRSPLLMARFVAEVNLTIDEVFGFMFPLGGTWQLDDANHPKYPIISTNLISGQRDYTFLRDEQGNIILDIHRVVVADSLGVFRDIDPVDQQTRSNGNMDTTSLIDGRNQTGTPTRYDKTANGIFLDLIPDYDFALGLKVFVSREGSYVTVNDTDKVIGFAYLFQEYFALRPAYKYAGDKGLKNVKRIKEDAEEMKAAIKADYGKRQKDVKGRVRPNVESNK